MFKQSSIAPSYEKIFIRQSLFNNSLRLDGRGIEDVRAISIKLVRNEVTCHSEVQWGSTIVIAVVSCKIIAPFPDRPNEGNLHFNTELSAQADAAGYSHAEISRLLEKIIKESETLDTESLCIINGEKVWEIKCDVRIVDASGGNIIDASVLAAISALKGFRKPEISFSSTDLTTNNKAEKHKLVIHHSDERDPLPLALHHTPLTLTIGVLKKGGQAQSGERIENGKEKFVLIVDPSIEEETSMDGLISFSINSFNEVCSINKPGGVSLPVHLITRSGHIALQKIQQLHEKLNKSLEILEEEVSKEKIVRVEQTRQYRQQVATVSSDLPSKEMDIDGNNNNNDEAAGIDKNDPILQWSNLHFAVPLKE